MSTVEDAAETDSATADEVRHGDDPAPAAGAASRSGRRGLITLLVCAVVLTLAGSGLLVRAHQLSASPAASNDALTDTEATTRVIGDVSSALGKVLSYTPQDTDVTAQAARELLAGRAARQYAALFGQVGARAKAQHLTLTTQVVRAAVTRLTDRDARLLVFLDQVAQRKGKPAGAVPAQLSVSAELRSGGWLITDITAR
ncbi:hypothetical protein [Streptomyces sp. NBC_00344]|uniref:hypothetical protein n=1 Tax=Streptomyces sp. NBC_00344 TaxID=2975720 RepID=UPI002E24CBF0